MGGSVNTLSTDTVQHFLNMLEPGQPFHVIYLKQDDSQASLTCTLAPSDGPRTNRVPALNLEGDWKSFHLDRVLSIQESI